jgi:hypothetical protein
MDLSINVWSVVLLFIFTFLLNLPFGYARAKSTRYSLRWFLYIHVPIPFIFLMRTLTNIEMRYIPLFAVAAVIGQLLGGKLEL